MEAFATVNDVINLFRQLSSEEIDRAEALLSVVSDSLREEGHKYGVNLDKKKEERPSFSTVLMSVTVDIVSRTLMTSTTQEPMVQSSETALGYSFSGTFLNPGGGLFIKRSELARLGLKRQRIGVREIYGTD